MIPIHCPMCHDVLGEAETSLADVQARYDAAVRRPYTPNTADEAAHYAACQAIVQEQNRQRDLLHQHYLDEHPLQAGWPYLFGPKEA